MSSKRWKNKVCAYCGGISMVGDHVVARSFYGANSKKKFDTFVVPACQRCNTHKSSVEHDVRAFLVVGFEGEDAKEVKDSVIRGLRKPEHARLKKSWFDSIEHVFMTDENDLLVKEKRMRMPEDLIRSWSYYLHKGVFFHKFGRIIRNDEVVYMSTDVRSDYKTKWALLFLDNLETRFAGDFVLDAIESTKPGDESILTYWNFKMVYSAMMVMPAKNLEDHETLEELGWVRMSP